MRIVLIMLISLMAGPVRGQAVESRAAEDASGQLQVADGLQVQLFAAEPLLVNPADIDVDHLGRVWVVEIVNYRRFRNSDQPPRPEGDRILVLDDTDGDGQADRQRVYYQGTDMNRGHGICVLGDRVLVSCANEIFYLFDDDGDLRADRKEILFTDISQHDHDHALHACVFGPDGKLYFNFGNATTGLKDKHGNVVVDLAGNEVQAHRNPYQEGMVIRANLDGSEVETLAWNFRNPWEVAIDSFGTLWQSDNDDDGNRATRVNYVMEYGNFGYRDELTGAAWGAGRTGAHPEIPYRHWHSNDPGVVPTPYLPGGGSPTGIAVYEGQLLPAEFRDRPIYCDAGPRVVRACNVVVEGAGFRVDATPILSGGTDGWFRPSDVCVAPDGSLLVADWYDPGVGGHRMQDPGRGRLFRVAPPGAEFEVPAIDTTSVDGAMAALMSPNQATRYLGWTALHGMGPAAEASLQEVFSQRAAPRQRARVLWLWAAIPGEAATAIAQAVADEDPNIRIVGLRLARQHEADFLPRVAQLVRDPSPAVRRECALALRHSHTADAARLWAELAAQFDGNDRWYLEALGIGAHGNWDACLAAYLTETKRPVGDLPGQEIVWRSRSTASADLLAAILLDPDTPSDRLPHFFRALDFQPAPAQRAALLKLVEASPDQLDPRHQVVVREALSRLPDDQLASNRKLQSVVDRLLDATAGTIEFVRLVQRAGRQDRLEALVEIARQSPEDQLGVEAVRAALGSASPASLQDSVLSLPEFDQLALLRALELASDARVVPILLPVAGDPERSIAVRRQAAAAVGASREGADALLVQVEQGELDANLVPAVTAKLHRHPAAEVRERVAQLLPLPRVQGTQALPPITSTLR